MTDPAGTSGPHTPPLPPPLSPDCSTCTYFVTRYDDGAGHTWFPENHGKCDLLNIYVTPEFGCKAHVKELQGLQAIIDSEPMTADEMREYLR